VIAPASITPSHAGWGGYYSRRHLPPETTTRNKKLIFLGRLNSACLTFAE
jgi:hypothetical protein